MEINKAIEDSWSKTVVDFEEAKKTGDAWLWNEEILRLTFLGNFRKQDVMIEKILAETTFHVGDDDYKPDLVIYINTDEGLDVAVCELKYFSSGWEKDLEKIRRYGTIGWHYGYFLAIGKPTQCEKIPSVVQHYDVMGHTYHTKALVHPTSRIKYAPDFKIAEDLLKGALNGVPYVVSEAMQDAIAIFETYVIHFDMSTKTDQCVIWVDFIDTLSEANYPDFYPYRWITLDDEGKIQLADEITGKALIGEFERNSYQSNKRKVKDSVIEFKNKIKGL